MAQIKIENLCKKFGDFTAVESSSLTIEDGEFFMLLGPSGCGKTTTLRMMAGLEMPTSGKIFINDEEVSHKTARDRDIAFVFQMFALYPHMTVGQNIAYPLRSQGVSKKETQKRVSEIAEILGITNILKKSIGGLSGGDRQRVALGRSIVREPKAFFMDEPLGALDTEFREYMLEELRNLHNRIGATTVYVTHDQLEAMQMGDKIAVMNHGVVEQVGIPQDIYDWPATMFVADFLGSPPMNFLKFNGDFNIGSTFVCLENISIDIPEQLEKYSGDIVLGVRPEHVSLNPSAGLMGRVIAKEYLGTTQILTIQTDFGTLKARISYSISVNIDDVTGLILNSASLTLFNPNTQNAFISVKNKEVLQHG